MGLYVTNSEAETQALGEELAKTLCGGEIVAFTGGLGSGKTAFCKGLARGLGCEDSITSPTFSIANYYRGRVPFAHFDAYRVTCEDDLEAAGFYDYLDKGAVVAVEWSENVQPFLSGGAVQVSFIIKPGNVREITIEGATGL